MIRQHQTERANQRLRLMEDSLLNLLRTMKYEQITVKDICQESNIPRRTFYHYFESKDDVLDAAIESMMMSCNLNAVFEFSSGREAMKQSFVRFYQFWEGENREILSRLLENGQDSRLVSNMMKMARLEKHQYTRSGQLTDKQIEVGILVGTAGFFALLFHWCRHGYQESAEEMAEHAAWILTEPLFAP